MRTLAIRLSLLCLLLLPVSVRAQAPLHLSSVSVNLWPEYDQPGLLVIYHIELAPDTTLPAVFELRVPAGSQVNAVAVLDSAKGLVNAPYESTPQGDWSALSITTNSLQLQVEYYVTLVKDGSDRRISYQWPGDNRVDTLDVNFLLPPAADLIKIDPAPMTTGPGQGGLTNYLIRTANPPSGQPFTVTIEYTRQTNELGIASLPVQAISTPGAGTPGQPAASLWSWVLGGLGLLLVVGGVIGFVGLRRGNRAPTGRRERKVPPSGEESEPIYCSECGKRARPGDIFCRTCGARLEQNQTDA